MVNWSEGDLELGGITVHYYRTGTVGDPPVMLLHGFGDNGRSWSRLAEVLQPMYDVVALDCCGHGKSGGPEHGFRERAASDVLGAIDALGLDRPVILGHSMGAATVGEVASIASGRLRGVMMEDPSWRDAEPVFSATSPQQSGSRAPIRTPEWIAWMHTLKGRSEAELRAMGDDARPEYAPIDRQEWVLSRSQFNMDIMQLPRDEYRKPWREYAQAITCPALLITGDVELGGIVTHEVAAEAARLTADLRIAHIPGADHNIRRTQWEPFSAAVTTFLAEVLG